MISPPNILSLQYTQILGMQFRSTHEKSTVCIGSISVINTCANVDRGIPKMQTENLPTQITVQFGYAKTWCRPYYFRYTFRSSLGIQNSCNAVFFPVCIFHVIPISYQKKNGYIYSRKWKMHTQI